MTKAVIQDAEAVPWSAPVTTGHGPREEPAEPHARATSPDEAAREGATDVGPAARVVHWAEPDFVGDIRAVARGAGGADPVEIRIRPELHDRVVRQMAAARKPGSGGLTDLDGVRLVVDEGIPVFPGYEVHRVPPDPAVGAARSASRHARGHSGAGPRAA